jgi:hypothetical protein
MSVITLSPRQKFRRCAMNLIGVAKVVEPPWEPDQGWRVLDPDGHVVDAGGKTVAHATLDLLDAMGALEGIPMLGVGQERHE